MHRDVVLSRESLHGALLQDTVPGLRLGARQEFARGRSRWCDGAGAWHITARHRWTWHCDIRGGQGDNFGAQCVPAVRKKASFTHVRDNLRGDVSGKRFSTHVGEGKVARIGEGRCGNNKRDG